MLYYLKIDIKALMEKDRLMAVQREELVLLKKFRSVGSGIHSVAPRRKAVTRLSCRVNRGGWLPLKNFTRPIFGEIRWYSDNDALCFSGRRFL